MKPPKQHLSWQLRLLALCSILVAAYYGNWLPNPSKVEPLTRVRYHASQFFLDDTLESHRT